MANNDRQGSPTTNDRGVIQLVEAIVDDTRDLLGAHVEALRDDVKDGLSSLGAAVTSSVLAFSIVIVTALLCGIAIAMTLIALGVPAWAAFWIVTVAAGALGFGLVLRVRGKARSTGRAAIEVAERVKEDVAALQLATTDDA